MLLTYLARYIVEDYFATSLAHLYDTDLETKRESLLPPIQIRPNRFFS